MIKFKNLIIRSTIACPLLALTISWKLIICTLENFFWVQIFFKNEISWKAETPRIVHPSLPTRYLLFQSLHSRSLFPCYISPASSPGANKIFLCESLYEGLHEVVHHIKARKGEWDMSVLVSIQVNNRSKYKSLHACISPERIKAILTRIIQNIVDRLHRENQTYCM